MKLHAYEMLGKLPKPQRILRIALFFLIVIMLFFALIPWQQFALGNGKVIAFSPTERLHTVNSPISGRIKKWYVDEGASVKPNDPIVDISDNDPELLTRLELEKEAIFLRIEAAKQAIEAGRSNLVRQKIDQSSAPKKKSHMVEQTEPPQESGTGSN